MNWDIIEGKWKQAAGAVKTKWGKLTDDDLKAVGGKRDQLVGNRCDDPEGIARRESHGHVKAQHAILQNAHRHSCYGLCTVTPKAFDNVEGIGQEREFLDDLSFCVRFVRDKAIERQYNPRIRQRASQRLLDGLEETRNESGVIGFHKNEYPEIEK